MGKRKTSIGKRLNVLTGVCIVPLLLVICYLTLMLQQFSERYDRTVNNITTANQYNLVLKEKIDSTMYIIVVNSERAESLTDVEEPQQLISAARSDFEKLMDSSMSQNAKSILKGIVQTLDTLEEGIEQIRADAKKTGTYDKNLERLDLDVRVQTELVQEQLQEYISNEADVLESMREKVGNDVRMVIHLTIVLMLGILLVIFFSTAKISGDLVDDVDSLRRVTRKAGQGDFSVRASLKSNDEEFGELADGFNQMVERIGNLVDDIQEKQKNLRVTEQKLLQAQINPHFLYNTLDTIIWLAEAGEKEEVIMMVTALSDFFRTTLSKGRDYITVQEEESHIRSYLQIQQFRYRDILEYEIDIRPELYQYQILKLTLQPLVENALYHGIKNKRGKGRIRVTGYMYYGYLVFHVIDNGMGMTPERLEEVQKQINGTEQPGKESAGFGLYNVAERLRLNYGQQYGVWLSSTYGEGTEIRVEIPAVKA